MRAAVRSLPRATAWRLRPPCSSDAPVVDKPHSDASPFALAWIAPCDTRIIFFASKIKLPARTPPRNPALKLEVILCVRSVISPVLSNLYLNEVDQMLERARERTRLGRLTAVTYARYADDGAPPASMLDTESRRSDRSMWADLGLRC